MKTKNKKKITGFFKKPAIIITILIIIWAVFAGLSTSFILSRIKRELVASTGDLIDDIKNKYIRGRTVVEDVGIYKQLKIKDTKCYISASGKEEIVLGNIVNDSNKRLGKLKIKLTFLNNAGEPIDVLECENAVNVIDAKGSAEFSVVRKLANSGETALAAEKRRCVSVEGVVSDFNVID
jgi:hypothetical protein